MVCHLPPGTSKWNKIEHRMFAHISMHWRGRPLTSHTAVIELIGATTTRQGLWIHAELDTGTYPTGPRSPILSSPPCPSPGAPSTDWPVQPPEAVREALNAMSQNSRSRRTIRSTAASAAGESVTWTSNPAT